MISYTIFNTIYYIFLNFVYKKVILYKILHPNIEPTREDGYLLNDGHKHIINSLI